MTRYAGLLRGVNVGGAKVMRTAELADAVRALGYAEVSTILASGNLLFETLDDAAEARRRLEGALLARFGAEVLVQVVPLEVLRAQALAYPFERARPGFHDYLVFVDDPEARASLLAAETDPERERVAPGEDVLYWTLPKGSTLATPFSKAQLASRVRRHVTTRNLNTIERMLG